MAATRSARKASAELKGVEPVTQIFGVECSRSIQEGGEDGRSVGLFPPLTAHSIPCSAAPIRSLVDTSSVRQGVGVLRPRWPIVWLPVSSLNEAYPIELRIHFGGDCQRHRFPGTPYFALICRFD